MASTTAGAARKVMRGSPIAWCMAWRKRVLHIAGRQGRERRGCDFLGHGKRQAGGFVAQAFDFGMALVQRRAHGNGQRRDASVQRLDVAGLGAVLALDRASDWMRSSSSVVRVCFWRARAAGAWRSSLAAGTRCRR